MTEEEVTRWAHVSASFSDGPGVWKCLRFGDGDKTYELTLKEVG